MERESFEDNEVAGILNESFISIKVDREERPDIDHVYMTVCQALTGHGGWPLTIIMTPDRKPFFAGTYFPKHSRMGIPGLIDVLKRVTEAWKSNRDNLIDASAAITEAMQKPQQDYPEQQLSERTSSEAYSSFRTAFDYEFGGFGDAPKFPTPHNLSFLLRYWKTYRDSNALRIVEKTLDGMYKGGIFDHIGFGFSRYSTDRKWLIPHFEKMLYDNALIPIAYLEAYQATGNNLYAEIAEKVFTYILRDMTAPDGGFYSAQDADSEEVEGKYYIWSRNEVLSILGKSDGEFFCNIYNITEGGNFEGKNIPNLIDTPLENLTTEDNMRLNLCRQKLFEVREKRIHPYKDDKILTSWNGLMTASLAFGSRVLGIQEYSEAAENAVSFILNNLRSKNGRLLARYRDGESAFPAFIDDYSFLVWGLIELYETTYQPEYLKHALELNQEMIEHFWDKKEGGLFLYGHDSEQLISRPKEIYDGASPSGNSVSTLNFLRLARLTGQNELENLADKQFSHFAATVKEYPAGFSHFLMALLFSHSKTNEIVIAGDPSMVETREMLQTINDSFLPYTVFHVNTPDNTGNKLRDLVPFLDEQKGSDNTATAYICENYSCLEPITNVSKFADILDNQVN